MDQQESHDEQLISEMTSAFNQSEFAMLLGMQIAEAYDGYARIVMDCSGKKTKITLPMVGQYLFLQTRHSE